MPPCTQVHIVRDSRNHTVVLPHEYVAGVCLLAHSESTQSFLLATYPYYASSDYETSKRMCFNPKPPSERALGIEPPERAFVTSSKRRRERRKRSLARRERAVA